MRPEAEKFLADFFFSLVRAPRDRHAPRHVPRLPARFSRTHVTHRQQKAPHAQRVHGRCSPRAGACTPVFPHGPPFTPRHRAQTPHPAPAPRRATPHTDPSRVPESQQAPVFPRPVPSPKEPDLDPISILIRPLPAHAARPRINLLTHAYPYWSDAHGGRQLCVPCAARRLRCGRCLLNGSSMAMCGREPARTAHSVVRFLLRREWWW